MAEGRIFSSNGFPEGFGEYPADPAALQALYDADAARLRAETEQARTGSMPERWQQLAQVERQRLQAGLGAALADRRPGPDTPERSERLDQAWDALTNLVIPAPSDPDHDYALVTPGGQDLWQLLGHAIDLEKTLGLVPDVDDRVPPAINFDKPEIVRAQLLGMVPRQDDGQPMIPLSGPVRLTSEQFDRLGDFLADSGVPLRPSIPKGTGPDAAGL